MALIGSDYRSVDYEVKVARLSYLNDVVVGPDGFVYMTRGPYSGSGAIVRLVPLFR